MSPSISFLLYFWVGFLCIGTLKFSSYVGGANVTCLERERQALLNFKQGLKDPSTRLSSWSGDDCCRWKGIRCNNKTGHVIKLNLRNSYQEEFSSRKYIQFSQQMGQPDMDDDFQAEFRRSCISGEINPSLLELEYLMHLDLSFNCFGGIGIPKFFGSFNKLTYLNLSGSGFGGRVPHELGNLSTLCYLDLNNEAWLFAYSSVFGDYGSPLPFYDLHVDSLHWLSHLSSLQHLKMRSLDLSMAADWLLSINMLPSIRNLQLPNCNLPNISTSLQHVNLSSLLTLGLSENMLGPGVPTWLFNISRLMSLNLDDTYLSGPLPTALGSLCNLQTLSLQDNFISGEINKFKECFQGCIRGSLKDLLLGNNELSGYLPHWLGRFTNLKSLDLFGNSLSGSISPSLGRLSSLTDLSLGYNSLSGSIPPSLGRLSSLKALDLRFNSLSGSIPPSLGRLSSLKALDLRFNSLSGSIPPSLGRLSSLSMLLLSDNQLNGSIPRSIGQLSNLEDLEVQNNSFHCILSEAHFSNLKKLKILSTYSTSLLLNVSPSWIPPFQLTHLMMDDCKLGPQFPPWIRTQKELVYLSLSNVSISDAIPDFFWNISSTIYFIDLSSNSISGTLLKSVGEKASNLMHLSLSSNHLMGSIPMSMCKMKFLTNLDLSNNHLMDEIPPCLGDLQFLNALNLENNSLSGNIPNSISYLSSLKSLHLGKNKLTGEFPASLRNCTQLITLDLGENRFVGKIPKWIGENLTSLRFLILRFNMFDGNLPSQLSLLSELKVLDLSQNNFSGTIPASFGNFSAMSIVQKGNGYVSIDDVFGGSESIWVSWKGAQYEYSTTVSLVININLSGNDLYGEIPTEITQLRGLQSLNLSKNHLTGTIPKEIGDLRWIESIDLSWNQLSGAIPDSLSNLTSLSRLNLSYNNFLGRIPSGNQLDTINDSSIYMGNPFLCGPPISNQCPGDETYKNPQSIVEDDVLATQLFYISMGPGFVVGFWIVCGILLFKRSWRIAYYHFFYYMGDWLYVAIANKVMKFKKKEGSASKRTTNQS